MAAKIAAPIMTAPNPTANSHPYTCNTCQVAFKGSDLQRGHMQSDWHRYNLKRRVASLPPLTSEIFAEKVLANQASAAATAARASFEKVCAACERTYYSQNAYINHLQSQKHKTRLVQLANENDASTEDETESMLSSTYSLGPSTDVAPSENDEEEEEDSEAEEEFARVVDGIKQTHLQDEEDDSEEENPISRRPTRPHHSSASNTTSTATPSQDLSKASPTLQCLFCNTNSADISTNISHMSKTHGLYIPEQSYLVDLPGLLSYLHYRVHALFECLYCGQLKYTTTGIKTHMRDKGHCMIAFESEAEMVEVGEFYDFTSTYSDDEEEDSDSEADTSHSNGVKLGATRSTTTTTEDGQVISGDEDWEEASDEDEYNESKTDDKVDAKPPRKSRANQAFEFDGELHLPSGRTAGHRSLARYFRQNLHNYPSAAERMAMQHEARRRAIEDIDEDSGAEDDAQEGEDEDQRAQRGYSRVVATRANGGLGLMSAPEHVRRAAAKMEIKEKRREQKAWNKFKAGNERQNNNQKHFRDPLLQ